MWHNIFLTACGIVICLAAIGLYFLYIKVIVPKSFLRFKYLSSVAEGDLNEDHTKYIGEKSNGEFVTSYSLSVDRRIGKKYIKIEFSQDFHYVKLYVILFNGKHQPIGFRTIEVEDVQMAVDKYIPIDNNVCGLYIQTIQADEAKFDKTYPCYIKLKNIVLASVFIGLMTFICSRIFYLGFTFAFNNDFNTSLSYLIDNGKTFWFLVVSGATWLVSTLVSFIVLRVSYKHYLSEDGSLWTHQR